MFLFKKPKPTLAELIPGNYTDIHSHLLPGIDDGAKDEQDSVALIKSLQSLGFSQFITTPHILPGVYNNTPDIITTTAQNTLGFYAENNIEVPFRAAAEYLMDDVFFKQLKTESLLTLKDRYVLVEMSYLNPPIQLYEIIFELQMQDYKPVLAHPERYLFYHNSFQEYNKLKKAGCLLQLNLLSVVGYYGKPVLETAKKLLDEGMIDFTGSDTHHERHIEAYNKPVLLKDTIPFKTALNNNSLFSI